MYFYKETILGQVLSQVQKEKKNFRYIKLLDDLISDIEANVYLDYNNTIWNRSGLVITDDATMLSSSFADFMVVETIYTYECTWLIEQLIDIYNPNKNDLNRLITTIGYLLNSYTKQFDDDITEILRISTISSMVFLHPDHLGLDKFRVHPIILPKFGKEF